MEAATRERNDTIRDWYRTYADSLYCYLSRFVFDPEERSDVLQEAFARAICRYASFEKTGNIRAWLYAIDRLPAKEREILHLFYYDELTVRDIALVVGAPAGTIMYRLFLARRRIAAILAADS